MRHPLTALATLAIMAASAAAQPPPAGYQFAYEWDQGGVPVAGGSLSAAAGSSFALQVYLKQTASGSGTNNLLVSEGGLFSGSVRTTYGGTATSTAGVITVSSTSDIAYNPRFNDTTTSNATLVANTNYAQFTASTDLTQAATPDATGRVLLGTFTYHVVGSAGSSTVLRAEIIPNGATVADTVTYTNFYNLDTVTSLADLQILIIPVPEPAGLLAAAVGAWSLSRGRRALKRFKA